VNGRISTLFRLCALATVVLVTMTAYWQVWAAPSLAVRKDNARLVYRQLAIKRGLVLSDGGKTPLAANRKVVRNGQTLYLRRYPTGPLYAHAVGYSTVGQSRTGLELQYNDYLTASNADLATLFTRLGDRIAGRTVTGDNLQTSLSPAAQRAAAAGLVGHTGAVVAIEPQTGRVLAMASRPSFDPENIRRAQRQSGAPLLNRATQGLYPPGSTFKVVTTTTALNSGLYTPQTIIDGQGSCITVSVQLCNAGGEVAGRVTLTQALTYSYNTVFAQVGQKVGRDRLYSTMRDYGFFTDPPLDYPSDEMAPSGLYGRPGHLLRASAPVDTARLAIGQERLLVTPLQMAEVAATIANGGVRMRLSLVDRAVTPDGKTAYHAQPQVMDRVMSPTVAAELTSMMRQVVEEGTGQAANLGGLSVAGKTGTAETGAAGLNTAWFIAFAPAENPQIAVAVAIEQTPEFGGTIAAPVARNVIEAYLHSSVAK
jgi:penicillin-binding protein A